MEPYPGRVPDRIPVVGDHVVLLYVENGRDVDLDGWVLNYEGNKIRLAASPDDDGRPDPEADWLRATFYLSEVSVIFR